MMVKNTILVLIVLIFGSGCSPDRGLMPITTSSKEALELFHKGRDMWECREQDKANEFLKQAIELDSNFAMAYVYYKMPTRAAKAQQLIDRVSPGEQLLIRGGLAYIAGDFEKAEILHDSLVLMYPKDKNAWLLAGNIYRNRNPEKSIECYKNAIDLDPYHAGAHRRLGLLLMRMKRLDEAEVELKEFLDLKPNLGNTAESYAALQLKKGEVESALKYYNRALLHDSTSTAAYMKIAWIYIHMNDYTKALEYCQKLNEFGHTEQEKNWVVSMLANIKFIQGNIESTFKIIDEAIIDADLKIDLTEVIRLMHLKGWYALQARRIELAIDIFKQGLELATNPTLQVKNREALSMWFHGSLSISYSRLKLSTEAAHHLNQTRMVYESVEQSWTNFDYIRVFESANAFYNGDYNLAIAQAEIRAHNECVLCQYYMAKSYEKTGNTKKAIQYYKMALYSSYPDFTGMVFNDCKSKLEKLDKS